MVRRVSRPTLSRDLERLSLCSEGNRHQPAPLLAYTLEWRDPDRDGAESPSFVTRVRLDAMTQGRARQTQGRENGHDHIARHRPRGAAARRRRILLQTQGLSRKGGSLAEIIRPLRHLHCSLGPSPALTRPATVQVRDLHDRHIVHGPQGARSPHACSRHAD